MFLNSLKSAPGATSNRKRVGRGNSSGRGRTCGKGNKGQKSRAGVGGLHKGFEGGQMPLHRRLPKYGFHARKSVYTTSVPLGALNKLKKPTVSLLTLKEAGLIGKHIRQVKIFLSGDIDKAVTIEGIAATAGARKQIIAKGGKIADTPIQKAKRPINTQKKSTDKKKPIKEDGKKES